jgi:DNA-binding response OmpR family regulator
MKKVMVVEDDKTMQSLIKTLLEIEGFRVELPGEMQENFILDLINKTRPDAMIMDVNLRQFSGIDLLTKIRSKKELDSIKILMSSGLDLKDDCMKASANAFLQKPYMPEQLIDWLKANIKS